MLAKLQEVAQWLELELKQELARQDHIASGKLDESIEVAVKRTMEGWVIEGRFLKYGKYVDKGRMAGVKRVPLDALIEWIRVKRITVTPRSNQTREAATRSMAFAIQTNIFKKGIPTNGDQSKKRWMSGVLENKEMELVNKVEAIATQMVDIEFTNLIERTQKYFDETELAA